MTELHVPKGVSRETLLAVVRGWYEAADLEEPDPPALAADLRVDDEGGIHLDAEPEEETE